MMYFMAMDSRKHSGFVIHISKTEQLQQLKGMQSPTGVPFVTRR